MLPCINELSNKTLIIYVQVDKDKAWSEYTMLRGYRYKTGNDPVAFDGHIAQTDETSYQLIFKDFDYALNPSDRLTLGYQDNKAIKTLLAVSLEQ